MFFKTILKFLYIVQYIVNFKVYCISLVWATFYLPLVDKLYIEAICTLKVALPILNTL